MVIGSGFAGLSAASHLAKAGWQVTVLEKHTIAGGRARKFEAAGFNFDMGPSWYWMPDVFERYFNSFGKTVSDYYALLRLNPSYRVYWKDGPMDIPADYTALQELFEKLEPGAGKKLDKFLTEAAYKYEVGINKLVHKPGRNWSEFLDIDLAKGLLKLDVFTSMTKHIAKYFRHPQIRFLLEFPVLFLGALPQATPALYSLMNYADIKLGTWFPVGGMYKIVEAMQSLAEEQGVQFEFGTNVTRIAVENENATTVYALQNGNEVSFDTEVLVGAADYHFIEQELLPKNYRSYSTEYWDKRIMAPSCLLFYIGLNRKLKNILHHSLFFDADFAQHAHEMYTAPAWPTEPLFYVSATSVTDKTLAPPDGENLFFLMPVAAGLQGDTEAKRKAYLDVMIARFEKATGENIKDSIAYLRSYAVLDFEHDYNAFKGNAYGLANTLMQTAIMKPSLKSKKINNLYYTGQLTVPGPGVPPSLISGEVVAREIEKEFSKNMTRV